MDSRPTKHPDFKMIKIVNACIKTRLGSAWKPPEAKAIYSVRFGGMRGFTRRRMSVRRGGKTSKTDVIW